MKTRKITALLLCLLLVASCLLVACDKGGGRYILRFYRYDLYRQ